MGFAYSATCNGTLQTQTALDYYPYGKELRSYNSSAEKYKSTTNERDLETGYDYRYMRLYNHDVVRFNSIDPIAAAFPAWSGYHYVVGNPISHIDPFGMDTIRHATLRTVQVTAFRIRPRFERVRINDEELEPVIGPFEHHYNGSLAAPSAAAEAYATMKQQPRVPIYQTATGLNRTFGTKINPTTVFKGARAFSKSADKILGKLGAVGMGITAINLGFEIQTGKFDAHSVVDIAFLGLGVLAFTETIALSPAIIVGLGVYGLADWVIDFDDTIDGIAGSKSFVNTGADTHLLPLPDVPGYDPDHQYSK